SPQSDAPRNPDRRAGERADEIASRAAARAHARDVRDQLDPSRAAGFAALDQSLHRADGHAARRRGLILDHIVDRDLASIFRRGLRRGQRRWGALRLAAFGPPAAVGLERLRELFEGNHPYRLSILDGPAQGERSAFALHLDHQLGRGAQGLPDLLKLVRALDRPPADSDDDISRMQICDGIASIAPAAEDPPMELAALDERVLVD